MSADPHAAFTACLDVARRQVAALATRPQPALLATVDRILRSEGKLVVTGVGKSGHVGAKIAATMTSLGTPAVFVHAGEAIHGDLGAIQTTDVVLALSKSGATPELLTLVPHLRRRGVPLIALTGAPASPLAQFADHVLDASVDAEGDPLGAAPMASTTAALVLGDALASAVCAARGFTREGFAQNHPGGALGVGLTRSVSELMRVGDAVPTLAPSADVWEILETIGRAGIGSACVVDDRGALLGLVTDGDVRRALQAHRSFELRVTDLMNTSPITTEPSARLASAWGSARDAGAVQALPVVDGGLLVGVLCRQDCA